MSVSSKIRNVDKSKVLGEDFVKKHEYKHQQLIEIYNFLHTKISSLRKAGEDVLFADNSLKVAKPKIDYYKASMEEKDYNKAMQLLLEVKNEISEVIRNSKENKDNTMINDGKK